MHFLGSCITDHPSNLIKFISIIIIPQKLLVITKLLLYSLVIKSK